MNPTTERLPSSMIRVVLESYLSLDTTLHELYSNDPIAHSVMQDCAALGLEPVAMLTRLVVAQDKVVKEATDRLTEYVRNSPSFPFGMPRP